MGTLLRRPDRRLKWELYSEGQMGDLNGWDIMGHSTVKVRFKGTSAQTQNHDMTD